MQFTGVSVRYFVLAIIWAFVTTAWADEAHEVMVTRHFSGIWDQVEHENQGISLQIVHQDGGDASAVAYWFTYGADRMPTWYVGIGSLVDENIEMALYRAEDVGFLQANDPDHNPVLPIGAMTIEFASCDQGTVSFTTDFPSAGSGSFEIRRLANIHNTHCSGTIADDFPADMMFHQEWLQLNPAREGILGHGRAEFESSAAHGAFDIEVEDLPDGTYRLFVGVHDRGEFQVTDGRAQISFRSPDEDGSIPLEFDPRGMGLEIHDDQGAVLSSGEHRFATSEDGQYHDHNFDCAMGPGIGGGHHGGMGGMHGGHGDECVEDGEILRVETELTPTGILPGAEGEAEWEMTHRYVEFRVSIESVPAGDYRLRVNGLWVGDFPVMESNGEVLGEMEFRDPQRIGSMHLDFDPRGQVIEVFQDDNIVLEGVLPVN